MREVTAAIIREQGKVLIVRRAPGQDMAGYWEFPGGKVEANETPELCLERELREELGITTRVGELVATSVYNYDRGTIKLLAYETQILSGSMALTVHDELRWVEPPGLGDYSLLPADLPIARQLAGL